MKEEKKQKHYLIYQTTNLVNGKIYIGQHQTYNLEDNYIGSGIELQKAIEQFGRENFKREILFDFDNFTDMDNKERELVTEEFVAREDTYNLTVGGQGYDFYVALKNGLNNSANNCALGGRRNAQLLNEDPEHRKTFSLKISAKLKIIWKEHPETFKNFKCDWKGRHHSEETKRKMSKSAGDRHGEKNNHYGKMWICNDLTRESRSILKTDPIPEGWRKGRICKK